MARRSVRDQGVHLSDTGPREGRGLRGWSRWSLEDKSNGELNLARVSMVVNPAGVVGKIARRILKHSIPVSSRR